MLEKGITGVITQLAYHFIPPYTKRVEENADINAIKAGFGNELYFATAFSLKQKRQYQKRMGLTPKEIFRHLYSGK